MSFVTNSILLSTPSPPFPQEASVLASEVEDVLTQDSDSDSDNFSVEFEVESVDSDAYSQEEDNSDEDQVHTHLELTRESKRPGTHSPGAN